MVSVSLPTIKEIYDTWDIQSFILLSFSLQAILILLAPLRKRLGNGLVVWPIWVAYLLSDWAANYAVGLIFRSRHKSLKPDDRIDIFVFWAPFLLLHLGGPDNITAFALEDNALWLRHLVGLLTQVVATVAIISQSLPRNQLWFSTIFLFVAGTIKYGERTGALYHANLKKFRESLLSKPDPGPDYAKHMERYSFQRERHLPAHIELIRRPKNKSMMEAYNDDGRQLDDIAVVKHAHHLFENFKGLIVDLIFSFDKRDESRLLFCRWTSSSAFEVLATELNFMYDVLYTKVLMVRSKFGIFVRVVTWCAVVIALLSFYSLEKHGLHEIDVRITYTLLFGAIGLEIFALFMLVISEWTVISLERLSWYSDQMADTIRYFSQLLSYFLSLQRVEWKVTKQMWCFKWARKVLLRRWSESLHTYNLIDYCSTKTPKKIQAIINCPGQYLTFAIEGLGLRDFYGRMIYVSEEPIKEPLWKLIFGELTKKSDLANDPDAAKRICSARGDLVLLRTGGNSRTKLMPYVVDFDYDQSLIIWHIATDLCDRHDRDDKDDKEGSEYDDRQICKTLSNYMLYLLVMQPAMMPTVAGIGQISFYDTCAEAKICCKRAKECKKSVHEYILNVETRVRPSYLKGGKSKSVLFDGCMLAQNLRELEDKWKLMSQVWVELLSYAASHCRANTHAAQLGKGGELITFVWLLMTHLGIGDQFQINEAAAKLVVGK